MEKAKGEGTNIQFPREETIFGDFNPRDLVSRVNQVG